jgi:glycosyltransferase involved in cell wall biosynthesis
MKISGAMIIRNGVKLGYPFVESVKSILPFCFEVVVAVGKSEDETRQKIEAIGDPRIRIVDTEWDVGQRSGGTVLSQQTNIALSQCTGDWIFYIQADEIADVRDIEAVNMALTLAGDDPKIEGVAFRYVHFYGSYYTVQTGRNWYDSEVRIIRNNAGIVSHGDAQGFRRYGRKLRAVLADIHMYHYGWARPPAVMADKIRSFHALWHDDRWIEENCGGLNLEDHFTDLGNLAPFTGSHPPTMQPCVNREFEPFILKCRENYLKHRTMRQGLRDLTRRLPMGKHRNYTLVNEL